ncbi:MAG: hypothetical protein WC681_12705 [Sterolibacterium sp.]
MSIVQAFVHPDCGIVCADTEAGPDDGPYIEVSKLIPLPHMNAVIAGRGVMLFLASVVTGAFAAGCDFDELARQMPDLLKLASDKAVELAPKLVAGALTSEEAGCGEVVIVGYSPARARIVGHHFRRQTLAEGFIANNNITHFVAPSWADADLNLQNVSVPPSKEYIKTLALAQLRLTRERETAGIATGGRLIYAEIRQSGMTIEPVMDFPARQ